MRVPLLLACCLAVAFPNVSADACTSFLLKHPDKPVMAKNFDWDIAAGMVVINPRGLAKTALVGDDATPARWTSRYGSATFNQYGREFPIGGMNEAGLAMEVLWLAGSEYPEAGERPAIDALQWVQYCLDSFRRVGDVVASASELAVSSTAPLHFLACDPTGSCAVIEFLEGRLVARSERSLPLPALTNDTYEASLEYLNRTLGYGGEPVEPTGAGSLARFARAADGTHDARRRPDNDPVTAAFSILDDVAQPDRTQWRVVYDLQATRVHFSSSGRSEIRFIELEELELDCTAEPLMLDLAAPGAGDVTGSLVPYTTEVNRTMIEAGFSADEIAAPAPEIMERLVAYPDTLLCTFAAE